MVLHPPHTAQSSAHESPDLLHAEDGLPGPVTELQDGALEHVHLLGRIGQVVLLPSECDGVASAVESALYRLIVNKYVQVWNPL